MAGAPRGRQAALDPGLVAYDGGLRLEGTPLWFDARRPVALSFVSSALRLGRHQRVVLSTASSELLGPRLGASQALASPPGRAFSVGELVLELVPSGHVLGGAQLLVRWRGLRILYCGGARPGPSSFAQRYEARPADVLVLDCPYDSAPYVFPSRARAEAAVVGWSRQVLASGGVPVLLARPFGVSQELVRLLSTAGLPVRAHPTVARWNRLFRAAGHDPGRAPELRRRLEGGAAVVAPDDVDDSSLGRLVPTGRRALVSGRALRPAALEAARAETAFALSVHADSRALRRVVQDSGAGFVYLGPRHTARFEAALQRTGLEVTRFAATSEANRTQLDLF